jgi:hypothetical protein
MGYKEVLIGFLLAGFVGLLGNDFFNDLFIVHAPNHCGCRRTCSPVR